MKKLMIAAAIVCAAAMVQAAQINWGVQANSWNFADKGARPTGQTIYLINAADWSTIESAIQGGKTAFTTDDKGILEVAATANTKGLIADHAASHTSLTAGTKYDFAALIIDTRDPSDVQYFASGMINQAAYDPADEVYSDKKTISFGSSAFTSAGLSGGWQSVPEPTSAMLLLLGVAGLALRRRRA